MLVIGQGDVQIGRTSPELRTQSDDQFLWGTERSGVTVTNWQGFGGWEGVVLRADHVLWPFWSRTILRAILKDLPPTQRCLGSVYFHVSAIGSASVQQLYTNVISSCGRVGGAHCKVCVKLGTTRGP